MTITGLFLTSLAYLNYQGLINVDWGKVVSVTNTAITEFSNSTGGYVSPPVMDSQVVPTMMNFGIPSTGSFLLPALFWADLKAR